MAIIPIAGDLRNGLINLRLIKENDTQRVEAFCLDIEKKQKKMKLLVYHMDTRDLSKEYEDVYETILKMTPEEMYNAFRATNIREPREDKGNREKTE